MDGVGGLADGRYVLHELVGSGGTGSVRRAHDTLLDRPVAVKMLRREGADETVRVRMRAEAQLAGSLIHPGIAQVFDYGEEDTEDGPAPYIVMQYVEGTSLWQVLRDRHTLPATEVMDVVAQVADALQVAHEQGIVHRDLKPANMVVTPDRRAVLVDFGIARAQDADPLTLTGAIVGTADYISPEQSDGRTATSRSDIYSLGMVAYECLTGRKPFRRETEVATALAHLREDAPPLGPEVPYAVRALVEQMIAKDPDHRPVDAAEVAARARALAEPAAAVQPSPPVSATHDEPSWLGHSWLGTALRQPVLRSRRVQVAAAALAVAVAASAFVAARSAALRVPDLEGQRLVAATRALDTRGLEVRETYRDAPGERRGAVLDQHPRPGSSADAGDVVTLTVATGRSELGAEKVLGESYDAAARDLVRLGLVPSRRFRTQAEGAGTVVDVHPTGQLPQGTSVTLVVAVSPG